jgi:thiamine-phosphate pyrophosphorylase
MYNLTKIAQLQFITSDDCALSHLEQIKLVLNNGVQWVQLRAKNMDADSFFHLAEEAKKLTEHFAATLIVNDHVEHAKAMHADGVHIGKNDIFPSLAREILGDKIIGGTANTLADIQAIEKYVDYVGLGPFRFTNTKKNLSPVLGHAGYANILQQMQVKTPVIAIGGLLVEDVQALMDTGIHGIAISGAIINAAQPEIKIKQFLNALESYVSTAI